MEKTNINCRLHELLGLHLCEVDSTLLRCKCGSKGQTVVPDYCADPRLVIEAMREKEDWRDFTWLSGGFIIGNYPDRPENGNVGLRLDYLNDTTGKLAKLAIEFLEERKG